MRILPLAAVVATALTVTPAASAASIWTPVTSGTTQDITAVDYRAPDQLYVATANGQLLKNGVLMAGSPGAGITFTGIQFNASGTKGIASANNGKLYVFNGATWSLASLLNTSFNQTLICNGDPSPAGTPTGNLTAVAWKDDNVAYVSSADRGVVLKTLNAGVNWADASRKADGTCRVDPGGFDSVSDVATVPGTDLVFFTTTNFGARRFSADGLAGSATVHNSTGVNCPSTPSHIAVDDSNPSRSVVVGACAGSLSLGVSTDSAANYNIYQDYPNGNGSDLSGLNDVAMSAGAAVAVGNAGAILINTDGLHTYFQRAEGSEQTTDWLAVDKFDATHAAVGGRGGKLVISTQASTIPDLVPPAGTITGPATLAAGTPGTFTANVADDAGGSGVDLSSFAWSATGVPAATGNPVSLTFPSRGVYTVTVSFKDLAGNAATATKTVVVSTAAAGAIPPGTINPTPSRTVSVLGGGTITLAGPKRCVAPGGSFSATLSYKKSRKKGAKKIKITKVQFSIDSKIVKTDKKSPFKQTLTVKKLIAGTKHTLKARAYIKVKKGRKVPKKSVSTSFSVCSS